MTSALGHVSTEECRGLYWASQTFEFPRTKDQVVLPREWVASSKLYKEVSDSLTAGGLAELSGRIGDFEAAPSLEKCVAEAIYEETRMRALPEAPSRLRCLFAARDAIAAIEFSSAYLPPPVFDANGMGSSGAFPVSTADGKWVRLDMNLFHLPKAIGADKSCNERALDEVRRSAGAYWRGEESDKPFVEVLCEKLWLWTHFLTSSGAPPAFKDFIGSSN